MMLIQLLILFFFIFNANSLKSSDLCFKQENQEGCTAGRNLHECEMNLCAFDHEACESFKTLRFHLKFGKSQKNEENTLAQINGIKRMRKRIEAYAKILKNITNCE
jgi:hypothetical protein